MRLTPVTVLLTGLLAVSYALTTNTSGNGYNGGVAGLTEAVTDAVQQLKDGGDGKTVAAKRLKKINKNLKKYGRSLDLMEKLNEEKQKFSKYVNKTDEKFELMETTIDEQFRLLTKTVDEKASEIDAVNTKQSLFENVNDLQKAELIRQKEENINQQSAIEELKQANSIQSTDLKEIKATNNKQNTNILSLQGKMKNVEIKDTIQDSKLNKLMNKEYFSVYLTKDITVSHGQPLKFDGVLDDPEHLYNKASGKFTCKVPGVYVFTLTVMSSRGHADQGRVWAGLFLNYYHLKGIAHCRGNYDQSSITVTLPLKASDTVIVKGQFSTHLHGSSHGHMFTTFNGRLITPQ